MRLSEMRERPQPCAFDRGVQLFALRLELVGRQIAGHTSVQRAQLTTMRVNGLGTRKRSQELHDPGVFRLQMKCADRRAGHLRQLDGPHFGLVDRARAARRR